MFFKKKSSPASEPGMNDHSFDVEWRFVVPPHNTHRIVISQRQDGPFRPDSVGGRGNYSVSTECLDTSTGLWAHVSASASGGYNDYDQAHRVASERWIRVRNNLLKVQS